MFPKPKSGSFECGFPPSPRVSSENGEVCTLGYYLPSVQSPCLIEMDVDSVTFVEWEEHIICHEKGSRVVHYYLKDALGESVLAVIGTERSIRHMIYVVSDGFLEIYGPSLSVDASTKWRARREVVDWLASMVSSERGVVGSEINGYNNDLVGSFEPVTGLAPFNTYFPEHVAQRKLKVEKASIDWSGVAGICAKQLKHYPSFTRDGTTIPVHSFVFVLAEEVEHYLGYLEDLYEDKKGKKKVKVRWFYLSQELNNLIPQLNLHPREVVITSHVQVISTECIDSCTTVLTPWHFEKYVADAQPYSSSSAVHMCFRQLKNNKIKPFALTKLNGYSNQSIVAYLAKQNGECNDLNKLPYDVHVRVDGKRKRGAKAQQGSQIGYNLTDVSTVNQPSMFPKLTFRLARRSMSRNFVVPRILFPFTVKVDEKIELLCEDSGIRGCWFRCKVLEATKRRLKVQYIDVQDVESSCNLEEWVPTTRSAAPDKLGIRCDGRQRVRPCPPEDLRNSNFEVGAAVDAWWSDGWWEGVVSAAGKDRLHVYLPGESKFLNVPLKHVRSSRDWIQNRWVDVNPKADILDYLSLNISCNGKLGTPVYGGASNSEQKYVSVSREQEERFPSSAVSKEMLNFGVVNPSKDNEKNDEMTGDKFVQAGKWSEVLNLHEKSDAVQVLPSAAGGHILTVECRWKFETDRGCCT